MAWSVLQSAKGTGLGVSSLTVAYSTANVQSGNKLISHIAAAPSAAATISSVADGASNAETQVASPSGTSGGAYVGGLFAMDVPAGDVGTKPSITVNVTQASDIAMIVEEVSGLATGNTLAAMIDGSAASVYETPSTSQAQPAYTSTAANELLYSILGDNGNSVTYTTPSGYTTDANNINGSPNADLLVTWKNSTNGPESGTWTTSGTPIGSGLIVVAFKLAAAGGPEANDPAAAQPGPAWLGRFDPRSAHRQRAVLYDNPPLGNGGILGGLPPSDPYEAQPGPAWRGRFAPNRALRQPAVLFDTQLNVTVPAVPFQGTANFPAPVVSATNDGLTDPSQAEFPPAWRGQFGPFARTSRPAVLYDVQLNVTVSVSSLEAVANFPTLTVNATNDGLTDPSAILPSAAWQNQFGPHAHASKRSVLFDTALVATGNASVSATPFEAIANFPALTVSATNDGLTDPDAALPSSTWQNQFGPLAHTSKRPVLFDVQLNVTVSAAPFEGIANFPALTVNATNDGLTDPPQAEFSPAWRSQFGPLSHTSKPAVLFDNPPLGNGGVLGGLPPSDPAQAQPGSAWRSQFTHTAKPAVLYDVQLNVNVNAVPFEAVASFPAPVVSATNDGLTDPEAALPGPAWQNQFGPVSHAARRAVRYDSGISAVNATVTPSPFEAIAEFPSPLVVATNEAPTTQPAAPGPAWRNVFHGAFSKQKVTWDRPVVIYGPFCFTGTEADTNLFGGAEVDANLYGGTATDAKAGYGGTATDTKAGYGGTETDTNPVGGAGVLGYGGTETDTNLYGGTATDANAGLGGTQNSGCFATMQAVNITLGEFNDETINLTITNNGSAFNLTGFGLQALLKTSAGIADTDPSTKTYTTAGGAITITSASGGLATLVIPHADLANTSFTFWRVDVTISGTQATAIYGSVTMKAL